MDKNTFFSAKNTDLIYTICRDEVIKKTQYNIDTNKKYYKVFGEIMKIVHKHAASPNDLGELNNKTIGKTIPYLVNEIEKKQIKEKPLIPTTNIINAPPIIEQTIPNRKAEGQGLPVSFRATPSEKDSDPVSLKQNFDRILNERRDLHEIPDNISLTVEDNTNYEDPNILMEKQMKEREMIQNVQEQHKPNLQQTMPQRVETPRVQRTLLETKSAPRNTEISLESYDLSNGVLDDLYGNADMSDMNTYNPENDNVDPMKLFEMQNRKRDMENDDYRQIQQDTINFEEQQKRDNQIVEQLKEQVDNKKIQEELNFHHSLSSQINNQMNQLNVNSIKSQLDGRIEGSLDEKIVPPTANDLHRAQDNDVSEESIAYNQLKKDIFEKRTYINRENLMVINSGDRDWYNEGGEDRYNFQIRFKPSTGSNGEQGLGVDTIYRNIVSFEMIRVLMAIENIIIPFDNRFFIDYKSLPYIALKIEELQPLYSGTNSRVNNTFAKLLFDKDHTNEIIVSPNDSATPTPATYTTKFSRQLKRGYSSMAPMSNEKKTFYPSPLASLNRLTISLLTPYGADIKNHEDVLTVSEIKYKALGSDLEIEDSTGFRGHNTSFYIEVVASTAFSNRVFKIGDNVKFQGFDSTSSDTNIGTFKDFINRETGHYIVNLEQEVKGATANEGYITKFYISPPGEIDMASGGTQTGYFQIGTSNLKDTGTCKVINQSIQTHFVFKVITREDDTTQFIKPANV